MKTKKRYYIIVFIVMILITVMVFFSDKIYFFKYDTSVEKSKFRIEKNSKSETDNELLWFTYNDSNIMLNVNVLLDTKDIGIYALKKNGIDDIKVDDMKTNSSQLGSFIAHTKSLEVDMDNDGRKDVLNVYAKTDTIATQGFVPVNTSFLDKRVPFEIVLKEKRDIVLYYNSEPLANADVKVDTKYSKKSMELTTNEDGKLKGLSLSDIRKGINITYEENGTYYMMSYQVEDNSLFTRRHYEAMKPLIIIFFVSLVSIILIIIIRDMKKVKRNLARFEFRDLIQDIREKFGVVKQFIKRSANFMVFRWFVMTISFIFIVYGVKMFGKWVRIVEVPVFACPQNQDQLLESACYTLSHLNTFLKGNETKEIITFFAIFLATVILFGRVLCGFICPFGFYQDIINEVRQLFKIKGMTFNEKIWNAIKLIKWQLIIIALGACFIGLDFCRFCPAIITSPAFAGFKVSLYMSGFVVILVTITSFFKRRLWCNICPLGALIGMFHKISIFRLRKNCQSCTSCGACYEACPMGIKSIYTERNKEDITTSDCIMCGECVKKCPENDAIALAICKKKFYVSSRFNFFNKKRKRH